MRYYSFILMLFCSFQVFSQAFNWTLSVPPRARNVNASQMLNNYTVCSVGGRPVNDSILFVGTSNTACTTWELIADFPSKEMLNDVHFAGNNPKGFAVGQRATLHVTVDNGISWNQLEVSGIPQTVDFYGTHFLNGLEGYIVGGKTAPDSLMTIVKTNDGAVSWTILKQETNNKLNDVFFVNSNVGYSVGDNGTLLKTDNAGTNWINLTLPTGVSSRDFNSLYFFDALNGIAVGGKTGTDSLQTIIKTIDGGLNWSIIKDEVGSMLNSVDFFDNSNGYTVGNNGVAYESINGGSTWTVVSLPGQSVNWTLNDVDLLSAGNGLISGNNGLVFISTTVDPQIIGIEEKSIQTELFPNPVVSNLTLRLSEFYTNDKLEFEIIDLFGNKTPIKSTSFSNNEFNFNLGSFSNGIYFLNIYLNDHFLASNKVVIDGNK